MKIPIVFLLASVAMSFLGGCHYGEYGVAYRSRYPAYYGRPQYYHRAPGYYRHPYVGPSRYSRPVRYYGPTRYAPTRSRYRPYVY